LEVKGRWATLFETTPEAQRLLCQEIERAIPGIFKHLGDHEGYRENTEYHAMVWPVEVVRR